MHMDGAGSLRSLILQRWESLGLQAQPSGSDNGVHASASPLEAAVERTIWMGTSMSDDPLVVKWKAAGLPLEMLRRWAENPEEVMLLLLTSSPSSPSLQSDAKMNNDIT